MLDLSATGDDDLLSAESKELEYRKNQLKQLQNEVLDIEELQGGISITDLTLDDFIMSLDRYMKQNPNTLEIYPTGIHAVTNINQKIEEECEKGVIYCLKQKKHFDAQESATSLYPYYLVYVKESGDIHLTNSNPKKILDIFKALCQGKTKPIDSLVKQFNKETKNGNNMSKYTKLLEKAVFDIKYVLFCAIVSTICFWVVWGTAKLLVRDKTIRGAFVQSSFRGSAAVMGLAFIQNIYGSSAMGPLMIVSAVPLYNIFSVIVLTFEANDSTGIDKKAKIRQAGINICKNPIILSILAGLIVGLLEIQFPTLVNKTVSNVAQMATPLALITIGAGFEGRKALAKIAPTMAASMIKLVLQPLVFLPVAAWMGFSGEKMIAILIMLASPTTPSCYIMAKSMNNDEVLTASVIVTTTLMAAFTLTGWIFLLKTLGYIG